NRRRKLGSRSTVCADWPREHPRDGVDDFVDSLSCPAPGRLARGVASMQAHSLVANCPVWACLDDQLLGLRWKCGCGRYETGCSRRLLRNGHCRYPRGFAPSLALETGACCPVGLVPNLAPVIEYHET